MAIARPTLKASVPTNSNDLMNAQVDELVSATIEKEDPLLVEKKMAGEVADDLIADEGVQVAGVGQIGSSISKSFSGFAGDLKTVYKSGPLPTERSIKPEEEMPILIEEPISAGAPDKTIQGQVNSFKEEIEKSDSQLELKAQEQLTGAPSQVAGGRLSPDFIANNEDFALHLQQTTEMFAKKAEKISYDEVFNQAKARGWTEAELARLVDPKQSMYANPGAAATAMLIRMDAADRVVAAKDSLRIAMKEGYATDQMKYEYLRLRSYEAAVIRGLQNKKTDVARTLGIFNYTIDGQRATPTHMQELLARKGGDEFIRLSMLLDDVSQKNPKVREWYANTIATMDKFTGRAKDMMYHQYYNSMLSSPDTLTRVFGGTALFDTLRALERPMASALGWPRYYAEKAFKGTAERPITARELSMNIAVQGRAMIDFVTAFARAAVDNRQYFGARRIDTPAEGRINPFEFDVPDDVSLGGLLLRRTSKFYGAATSLPTRGIVGMDDAFKAHLIRTELTGLATRHAEDLYRRDVASGTSEVVARDRAAKEFAEMIHYPTQQMWDQAIRLGEEVTLTARFEGPILKKLEELANLIPGARTQFPFVHAPLQFMDQTTHYIPALQFASKSFRKQLTAGGIETDKALAKVGMGWAIGYGINTLTDNGVDRDFGITGAMMYPTEERKRRTAMNEKPFSIWRKKSMFNEEEMARLQPMIDAGLIETTDTKIYLPYTGFEPASAIVAAWATATEFMAYDENDKNALDIVMALSEGAGSYLGDMPMLTQVGDIFQAAAYAESNEQFIAVAEQVLKGVSNFGVRATPTGAYANLLAYVDRYYDDTVYQAVASESALLGEDYSDIHPLLRSLVDTVHQMRVNNPLWKSNDGSDIPAKYNTMTGEMKIKESTDLWGYILPIRPGTEEVHPGYALLAAASTDFPYKAPRTLEGVDLGGDMMAHYEWSLGNEPIMDEAGNPIYGGTVGEELEKLSTDKVLIEQLGHFDPEVKKEAQLIISNIVADARKSAKYSLMRKFPAFKIKMERREKEKTSAENRSIRRQMETPSGQVLQKGLQ